MDWQALSVAAVLLVFFGGVLVTVIHGLLRMNQAHVDRRFESLESDLKTRLDGADKVKDELKEFKAYVAMEYVHREDFVRVEGAREVKLDRLNDKLNTLSELIYERLPAR